MKIKILSTLLLSLAISGCQKKPEEVPASQPKEADTIAQAQFEKSDKKLLNI